ncbi:MAG TPA: hypothetical protein VHV29_19225 [Terriglobales bacterium]|nr:hypothetical protein [Terriglobales bacterium]
MKSSAADVLPERIAISGHIAQLSTAAAALSSVLHPRSVAVHTAANSSLPISLSALTMAFAEVARTQKVLQAGTIALPEVAAALIEYQQLLREFKSNLPRFQGWLLAERARLAMRGAHSTAVESWVKTDRQTRKSSPGRERP